MTDSHSLNEYRFDVTAFFGAEHYRKSRSIGGRWQTPAWLNPRRLRARDRAFRKASEATRSEEWQIWRKQATEHGRLAIAPRGKAVTDVVDAAREEGLSERTEGGFAYGQSFAVQVFADDRQAARACVESVFRAEAIAASGRERATDDRDDAVSNKGKEGRVATSSESDSARLFAEYTIKPFDVTQGEGRAIAAVFDQLRAAYVARHKRILSAGSPVGAEGEAEARADGGGSIEPTGSTTAVATVGRTTLLGDYGAGHPGGVIWADLTSGSPTRERPRPTAVEVKPGNEFRFDVGACMGTESYRSHPIVSDRHTPGRYAARRRAAEAADLRAYGDRWPAWRDSVTAHGQIAFAARGAILTDPANGLPQSGPGSQSQAVAGSRGIELVEPSGLTSEIAYGQVFAVQVFAEDRKQARAYVETAFDEGVYAELYTGYRIEQFDRNRRANRAIAAEFDRLRDEYPSDGGDSPTPTSNAGSVPDSKPTYVLADYGSGYPAGVIWADLAP